MTIEIFWFIAKLKLSVLVPIALGALAVCSFKRDNWLEILGLSYPVGIGIVGLTMFTLMHIQPIKLLQILLALLIIAFILVWLNWKCRLRFKLGAPAFDQINQLTWLLLAYLCIKTGWVFTSALIKPVLSWDAVGRYGQIAKGVFLQGTYLSPYLHARIEDYPPLIMLNQAWQLMLQGQFNDSAALVIGPMLWFSILVIAYVNLRKNCTVNYSLLACSLLASVPFFDFHATTAYLDLPQAVFFSIGAFYLISYFQNTEKPNLLVALIILGLGVWVKRAGMYLALAAILWLSIFLWKKREKIISSALVPVAWLLALAVPWFIYNKITSVSQHHPVSTLMPFAQPGSLADRFPQLLAILWEKFFFSGNWHLLWLAFLLVCVLGFRQLIKPHLGLGLGLLCTGLFLSLYPLLFTSASQFLLDGTLLNRVVLYSVPLTVYLGALIFWEEINTAGQQSADSKVPPKLRSKRPVK